MHASTVYGVLLGFNLAAVLLMEEKEETDC